MNKREYDELLTETVKDQIKEMQTNKDLVHRENVIVEACLTNIMHLMAHLTDEVSSVADEIKALREEIANSKGEE